MNRTPVADWQQLSALYELADALDPVSLEDWLAQLQAQSHPLLRQLREMLAARSQIQGLGFLGTLPKVRLEPEPRPVEWQAGHRLGVYRLLRRLGTGGMAEVWLAERDDGVFERQVAIKLLFRNERSSERDSFARRFERERHILASLDHPNIAGLHDAGVTRDGQPWLALEYVEGQTLTTWCDARQLGIEARVRLFRQVLLAVQHAHANLVIHRDLKPGNILVTGQGEVRLLDFGIAKLMEPEGGASVESELTRMAGRPMTPQYAAPEQLLGQPLTTACDVYALGVVLYELLCGERPYELKVESAAQLEQASLETEPRAPSRRAWSDATAQWRGAPPAAVRKVVSGDLDAIVLRALAKQPSQRYGSVEALRADLDRWLDGEPVSARAPSALDRAGKFVRRHVLAVSMSAAAVVTLAVVAAVAIHMGLQAREDSARAVAARDFMLNIFARANQEKSRGADITARDLLETGRKDVMTRLAGQPVLQVELLRGIAKIQREMGEYQTADSTFRELVRVLNELLRPREEFFARLDQAGNAFSMSDLDYAARLLESAKRAPGRPMREPAADARIAELDGWIALNSGRTANARATLTEARSRAISELGVSHLATFRLGQALLRARANGNDFAAALHLHKELVAAAPSVKGLDADEFSTMDVEFVNVLITAGHFARAREFMSEALLRCESALGPGHFACSSLFIKQQQVLLRQGEFDLARGAMTRAKAIAADPTFPFLQSESRVLVLRLSDPADEIEVGRAFEALRALGLSGPEATIPVAFKAAALLALGESRLRAVDPIAALLWTDRAADRLAGAAGQRGVKRLQAVAQMLAGIAEAQQKRPVAALQRLLAAHDGFVAELGRDHVLTRLFDANRAIVLFGMGRHDEAIQILRDAERAVQQGLGPNTPVHSALVLILRRMEEDAREPRRANPDAAEALGFFS